MEEWATNQSIDQSVGRSLGRPPLCERLRVQLRRIGDGESGMVCQRSRQEFWQDFANQRLNLEEELEVIKTMEHSDGSMHMRPTN